MALLGRGRMAWGVGLLLLVTTWLPFMLVPLRSGTWGIAPLDGAVLSSITLGAIVLPLVALLVGADTLAGEMEDGTLSALVTLPISRRALLIGKYLGRAAFLLGAEILACGSVSVAAGIAHGFTGARDFLAVAGSGLLLSLSTLGVGVVLGAGGRGRARALGVALLTWVTLAFVVDGFLLLSVVALAPPPPARPGVHGHAEINAPDRSGATSAVDGVLMPAVIALDPIDLFRILAVRASTATGERLAASLSGMRSTTATTIFAASWLGWLVVPPWLAYRRFRRVILR